MPETDLIVMEDDAGTIDIPRDLAPTPPAPPAPPVPAPSAADGWDQPQSQPAPDGLQGADAGGQQPPAAPQPDAEPDPDRETDPRVRGILQELRATRAQLKEANRLAESGRALATALRARPDLIAQLTGQPPVPGTPPAAPPAAPAPTAPPEPVAPPVPLHQLRDLAETVGLYTADGKPDIEAAKRVHAFTQQTAREIAESVVQSQIAPLNQRIVLTTAQQRRAEALAAMQAYGVSPEAGSLVIDSLLQSNPELLADTNATATAILMAIGLDAVQKQHGRGAPPTVPASSPSAPAVQPQPARPAPTFTEGPGLRPAAPTMSPVEAAVAKRAGIKPQAWLAETTRLMNAGNQTFFPMEDDE